MNKTIETNKNLLLSVIFALLFALSGIIIGILVQSEMILFDGLYSLISFSLSLLSIFALRFKTRASVKSYPFGVNNVDSLVIIAKFTVILMVVIASMSTSLMTMVQGGNHPNFGIGIAYALISTVICALVTYLLQRSYKKTSDPLMKAEASQWLFDSVTSLSVFISFVLAQLMLRQNMYVHLVPYIDPMLVIILGFYLSTTPLKQIAIQIKILLEKAPNEKVMKQLNAIVKQVEKKYGFQESFVRASQGNQSLVLEIDFVVSKTSCDLTVLQQDMIREHIAKSIRKLPYEPWVTISFTTDRKWAI